MRGYTLWYIAELINPRVWWHFMHVAKWNVIAWILLPEKFDIYEMNCNKLPRLWSVDYVLWPNIVRWLQLCGRRTIILVLCTAAYLGYGIVSTPQEAGRVYCLFFLSVKQNMTTENDIWICTFLILFGWLYILLSSCNNYFTVHAVLAMSP